MFRLRPAHTSGGVCGLHAQKSARVPKCRPKWTNVCPGTKIPTRVCPNTILMLLIFLGSGKLPYYYGCCHFPFKYGGITYNQCYDGWCSIKVDANGNHISGWYEYCDETCRTYHKSGKF